MWQSQYVTTTDVPAETLFRAISDISRWPEWDNEIDFIKIESEPQQGTQFILKAKGGPSVHMSIEELQAPSRMVDIAHLPLGKIRTYHEFLQSGDQTTIQFTIQVYEPLGFFWRKVAGEKQIQDAAKQTAEFIQYATDNY